MVRCDFDVPVDKDGLISEDCRILKTAPTIKYLAKKQAKIILIAHLGRPQEVEQDKRENREFTLKPVADKLENLLKKKIIFLEDCIGEKVERRIDEMKEGDIILLENLRFYREEEENDENFAKKLAALGDIYINDAFGTCHRAHASMVGVPKYLPSGAGFFLEKEIKILSHIFQSPWHPLVVVIGGVKIDTKINLIKRFLEIADHMLLGGEIANVILEEKGIIVARPPFDPEIVKKIEEIDLTNPKLHLPVDGLISLKKMTEDYFRIGAIGSVKKEEKVFDIGPETIEIFSDIIKKAKMILLSGPLGMFEKQDFEAGTREVAKNIVRNHLAFKVAGGGDTIFALNKFGLMDKFDYVSTGGGAMLEFLSGKKLPAIEALK